MGIFSSLFGCNKPSDQPSPDADHSIYQCAEPENTAGFTYRHVATEGAEILHFSHDADDGSWQFLCDGDHIENDAMILGIGEIVKIDPSVNYLREMPEGVGASRETREADWTPFKLQQQKWRCPLPMTLCDSKISWSFHHQP